MTSPTSREIVRLNVGGHLFTTTKSTLKRFPTDALDKILRKHDKEGNVFVDRDGRMFQYILGFLRSGKLCLPDDFSEFDSLTTEVEAYGISYLFKLLQDMKRKKMFVKSIEVLETTKKGRVKTILKGKKEDLMPLLSTILRKRDRHELEDKEDLSFVKLRFNDQIDRLQLAELLRRNEWTCESSDLSSSSYCPPNDPKKVTIEHCIRDRWKKNMTQEDISLLHTGHQKTVYFVSTSKTES